MATEKKKISFKGGTSGGTKHMEVTSIGKDYVYGISKGQGVKLMKGTADYAAALSAYREATYIKPTSKGLIGVTSKPGELKEPSGGTKIVPSSSMVDIIANIGKTSIKP
jgi:hypothetical protein|tara:strand:+ start:1458 stop:1784 length:327 start_codon:yes stop_codon:yes gene_type:complete